MEANASVDMFSKVLENQLLQATKLEEYLDAEIQTLVCLTRMNWNTSNKRDLWH